MNTATAAAVTACPPAGLDHHHVLTAEQIAQYQDQGFIKLRQVLSPATLAAFQPAFSRFVAQRAADLPPLAERTTYGKAFQQIMNLWREEPVAKEFVFSRTLARIAAELMGVAGVRLYHDQALFKEAGGGATPWHADQFYWPLATNHTVTAWIPLQDTALDMGPLAFSAGSHRLDLGRELEISDESEREVGRRITLKQLPVEESPFAVGDVSFHSGWTFHRAGANRTARPREVMTMIYFADGTKLARPANRNQESDWHNWLPGAVIDEPIDTAINPVLYHA
jgi:ectoine hydroxylase-related dioxygenase (phytanoyl-CoA dioxygenase family)